VAPGRKRIQSKKRGRDNVNRSTIIKGVLLSVLGATISTATPITYSIADGTSMQITLPDFMPTLPTIDNSWLFYADQMDSCANNSMGVKSIYCDYAYFKLYQVAGVPYTYLQIQMFLPNSHGATVEYLHGDFAGADLAHYGSFTDGRSTLTISPASAVPEPAAVFLCAIAMLALGTLRRLRLV
jgi:hypothetical protein